MLDQERDIVLTLAKRRHVHLHHREPEVEILPERARGELRPEVPVRGGHDARVKAHPVIRPDPAHLPRLERAEQLGLEIEGQLADLVDEERAAVRLLEQTRPRGRGAGEGPRTWPNSSASMRLAATELQSKTTNALPLRGLWAWIALARTSFPVPDSGDVAQSPNDLGGFSILQAESKEALAATMKDHPHFMMPDGWIEIVEVMPIPGM
jgi:hypothetical protein